jgi:hypothetical protein
MDSKTHSRDESNRSRSDDEKAIGRTFKEVALSDGPPEDPDAHLSPEEKKAIVSIFNQPIVPSNTRIGEKAFVEA